MEPEAQVEPRTLREEHVAATRQALLDSARLLFTAQGYESTTIDEIVTRARLTRGALYHHFSSKEAVLRAVVVDAYDDAVARLRQRSGPRLQPASEDLARYQAYIDVCLEPDLHQILLVDGPAILGLGECIRLMEAKGLVRFVRALESLVADGVLVEAPAATTAHLLAGLAVIAGTFIVQSPDRSAARRDVKQVLDLFLAGLHASEDAGH